MKQIRFGLFENAQANSGGRSTWRHPENTRDQFDTMAYWRDIARICEDATFDFLFLADAWGWSEVNGVRPDIATTESLDLPRLDPAVVLASLIPVTEQLGLVMTGSVLLEHPYNFSRRMASLDQLSGGRLGWNIVTTGTAETAVKAFGMKMVEHDERYQMADDFLHLAYKLWEGAWDRDALEKDKSGLLLKRMEECVDGEYQDFKSKSGAYVREHFFGKYAELKELVADMSDDDIWKLTRGGHDPAKVHHISHEGKYFRSDGYGNTAYSPQGTPVLFQAGASPAGMQLGGRHGECIFIGSGSVSKLAGQTEAIRAEAVKAGRNGSDVKVMSAFSCVLGATPEDAARRYQRILDTQTPDVTVASYAMFTGIDLSAYSPDTPMRELRTEMSQSQVSRFADQTVGDVLNDWHTHGVGTQPVVGTPEQIADEICALTEGADLDGILLEPLIQPGSTVDFVESVLPILRRRGVAPTEYQPGTLRERLTGSTSPILPENHPAAAYRA